MKERTKTLWMIAKIAILAVLMLSVLWSGLNTVSVSALISMVIAIILVSFIRWRRASGTPESDERTKKLGAYAGDLFMAPHTRAYCYALLDRLFQRIQADGGAGTRNDAVRNGAVYERVSLVLQQEG